MIVRCPPKYFYDDLGSVLFEAITLLPEYGLTRADERLLQSHADEILDEIGAVSRVAELGSGTGRKTRYILTAAARQLTSVIYTPIDVSRKALESCEQELCDVSEVRPICADWMDGLEQIAHLRKGREPLLLLFLGSSIGNLDRADLGSFLRKLCFHLRPGDFFLVGADLVKDLDVMIAAYDDPTGVTAAFNLNVLARINRELRVDFDLRSFEHEIRWNQSERRIEMHLRSRCYQEVRLGALNRTNRFAAGETVCPAWPFVEMLWRVH